MRVLLDTHALVWWVSGDDRLSHKARATIADPATEVFLSIASGWEIQIKASLHRLALHRTVDAIFRSLIVDQNFRLIGIELSDIDRLAGLPSLHRDPFDRMLVAQAMQRNLVLVSKDAAVGAYGAATLW